MRLFRALALSFMTPLVLAPFALVAGVPTLILAIAVATLVQLYVVFHWARLSRPDWTHAFTNAGRLGPFGWVERNGDRWWMTADALEQRLRETTPTPPTTDDGTSFSFQQPDSGLRLMSRMLAMLGHMVLMAAGLSFCAYWIDQASPHTALISGSLFVMSFVSLAWLA